MKVIIECPLIVLSVLKLGIACRIPGKRQTFLAICFTRELVGQIIFYHFSNSLVNALDWLLTNTLAESLSNILDKTLVNLLTKTPVNMLTDDHIGLNTD